MGLQPGTFLGRESAHGHVDDCNLDEYVYQNYGSYAGWWKANRFRSLKGIRIAIVKWEITREKQLGFVSREQENQILGNLQHALLTAQEAPKSYELPPPTDFTVDELLFEQQELEDLRKNAREHQSAPDH